MANAVALTPDHLRRDGEAFMEEISREYYLAHSGQKASAELQPVYEKYAAVLGPDALSVVLELFRVAPSGTDEHRGLRLLTDWLAETQSSRALAPLDEREIAWEGTAVVRLPDDREIEYQRVAIELANTADARERHAIEKARANVVERELAPMRRERFQRERQITERLELADGYNATFELLSGVKLDALRGECETFLRSTQAMWDDVLPDFLRTRLGMKPDEATRADALALFRAKEFDQSFPPASMESSIRRQVREMGIDPSANGRIIFDTGDREGKRSRAFCAPVRVPNEVYLVMRPHGGQTDWNTFLHELGHALHFAYMRPDLPYEFRWLGDNSITEGYAMLFDHLMQNGGWLTRYTALGTNSSAGTRRSWVTRSSCTAGEHGTHFPICMSIDSRQRRAFAITRQTRSSTSTRATMPLATYVPGSSKLSSRKRSSTGSTATGGATRALARGSARRSSVKASASSRANKRNASLESSSASRRW